MLKLSIVAALLCHIGADIDGHGAEGGRRVSSERSILFGPGLNRSHEIVSNDAVCVFRS